LDRLFTCISFHSINFHHVIHLGDYLVLGDRLSGILFLSILIKNQPHSMPLMKYDDGWLK